MLAESAERSGCDWFSYSAVCALIGRSVDSSSDTCMCVFIDLRAVQAAVYVCALVWSRFSFHASISVY